MQRLQAIVIKLKRIIRNFFLDMRYGGFLGLNLGVYNLRQSPGTEGALPGEFAYSPYHWLACLNNSDIEFLEVAFKDRINPDDVLVDVGCGRGRAITWWLDQGVRNRITGLELDPITAGRTRRRLSKFKNVTILTGDAVQNFPADGTLFFLNNPFGEAVMKAFIERLKSITTQPQKLRLLYYNPEQLHLFQQDPAWDIRVETVPTHPSAPFHPFAIITLRR